jgi:predicted Rossmann-fold nucleotide-binding protein
MLAEHRCQNWRPISSHSATLRKSFDVFTFLSSPSSTVEQYSSYRDREYYAAERLGREMSNSCHLLYSECKTGLLYLISEIEH